jgi:hypothetical protein
VFGELGSGWRKDSVVIGPISFLGFAGTGMGPIASSSQGTGDTEPSRSWP